MTTFIDRLFKVSGSGSSVRTERIGGSTTFFYLTFSITEGMAFGFISYAVIKVFSSQRKEVHPVVFDIAALFLLRYFLFIR